MSEQMVGKIEQLTNSQTSPPCGQRELPLLAAKELIRQGLETLEMVYNCHDTMIDHNETMWRATRKIAEGYRLLGS